MLQPKLGTINESLKVVETENREIRKENENLRQKLMVMYDPRADTPDVILDF